MAVSLKFKEHSGLPEIISNGVADRCCYPVFQISSAALGIEKTYLSALYGLNGDGKDGRKERGQQRRYNLVSISRICFTCATRHVQN